MPVGDHPDYTDWCGKTHLNGQGQGQGPDHLGLASGPSEKEGRNWEHAFIPCPLFLSLLAASGSCCPGFSKTWWTVALNWKKLVPHKLFWPEYFIRATGEETKTPSLSLAPFSFQTAVSNVFTSLQMSSNPPPMSTYSHNLSQHPFDWKPSLSSPYWVQHLLAFISMSQYDLLHWRCGLMVEHMPNPHKALYLTPIHPKKK